MLLSARCALAPSSVTAAIASIGVGDGDVDGADEGSDEGRKT